MIAGEEEAGSVIVEDDMASGVARGFDDGQLPAGGERELALLQPVVRELP